MSQEVLSRLSLFEFACHEGNYWSMRSMLGGRDSRIDN